MSSFVAPTPIWHLVGDHGVMIDYTGTRPLTHPNDNLPSADLSRFIIQIAAHIRSLHLPFITDIVPSLARLYLAFDPSLASYDEVQRELIMHLDQPLQDHKTSARLWQIPLCCYGAHAPDLADIAERTNSAPAQVIERLLASQLEVAVMGFLPGLGYMTGLDEALTLPRKANPRTHVPAGSVGIAIGQAVIYPVDSPGGWNLIGRTAVPLFDKRRSDPILLRPSDKVQFVLISAQEYEAQQMAYAKGDADITLWQKGL